jgi:hypothetical protein
MHLLVSRAKLNDGLAIDSPSVRCFPAYAVLVGGSLHVSVRCDTLERDSLWGILLDRTGGKHLIGIIVLLHPSLHIQGQS